MHVYVTRIKGIEIVSDSFRHAMRSAAVILVPDRAERDRLRKLGLAPALSAVNAPGSFWQILRYMNERRVDSGFTVYEHTLGGPPGIPSLTRVIDLNESLDPSYEVQAALWDTALEDNGGPLKRTAEAIGETVADGLAAMRAPGDRDEAVLSELLWMEERMGGIKVIPAVGRPKSVLDRLPEAAASMFMEIAGEAFAELR